MGPWDPKMKPGCSQDSSQRNGGGGQWWHTEEDPEGISYSSSQREDKDGFLKFIVPHIPKPPPQLWDCIYS